MKQNILPSQTLNGHIKLLRIKTSYLNYKNNSQHLNMKQKNKEPKDNK